MYCVEAPFYLSIGNELLVLVMVELGHLGWTPADSGGYGFHDTIQFVFFNQFMNIR